jgi:hypothetical protein
MIFGWRLVIESIDDFTPIGASEAANRQPIND